MQLFMLQVYCLTSILCIFSKPQGKQALQSGVRPHGEVSAMQMYVWHFPLLWSFKSHTNLRRTSVLSTQQKLLIRYTIELVWK